jgi:type I restriction enzyme S subunit
MTRWPMKPLGEIISLEYGKALKAEDRSSSGRYPVYGSNGVVGSHNEAVIKEPTIVVGRKGAIGEAHLAESGCWPIDTAFYTVFRESGVVSLRYLLFWFLSVDLKSHAITATIPGLNRNTLYAQRIPIPPLSEQERIVKFLDEADELRKLRAEADRRSADLIPALFNEMFGDPIENPKAWEFHPVSSFVAELFGGRSVNPAGSDESAGHCRVLKISAVTWGDFRPEESKPVAADYEPPVSHIVRPGDLLFSRANTTELVGATSYVFETPSRLLLPDKLWRFVWKEPRGVEPLFVWWMFRAPSVRQELGKRATGTGGSMKNISKPKVMTLLLPVPPLALQKEFAKRATEVRELEAGQAASRQRLDDLFQSMLHRAFSGEL